MLKPQAPSKKPRTKVCANCGETYPLNDLAAWALIIEHHKPYCSLECNIALGQVKNE